MKPSLDIVIVNWNSGAQLRECLRSIARGNHDSFALERVVVVDNASSDGSADDVGVADLPVVGIRNTENRGFAAACNQGAAGSSARYILFLNPDTVLYEESLRIPVEFLEAPDHAAVGICGIALYDAEGQRTRSCSRFPTTAMFLSKMFAMDQIIPARLARQRMTDWDHTTNRDVDQVIGAFFLIRRDLFERLGGFDERFFVYFEEVDLARRAAELGYRSHYLATARAFHRGGGCTDQVKARRLTYSIRSRLAYASKHFSRASATTLALATIVIEPISRIIACALRGSAVGCAETVRGFRPVWKEAPEIMGRMLGTRPR